MQLEISSPKHQQKRKKTSKTFGKLYGALEYSINPLEKEEPEWKAVSNFFLCFLSKFVLKFEKKPDKKITQDQIDKINRFVAQEFTEINETLKKYRKFLSSVC